MNNTYYCVILSIYHHILTYVSYILLLNQALLILCEFQEKHLVAELVPDELRHAINTTYQHWQTTSVCFVELMSPEQNQTLLAYVAAKKVLIP